MKAQPWIVGAAEPERRPGGNADCAAPAAGTAGALSPVASVVAAGGAKADRSEAAALAIFSRTALSAGARPRPVDPFPPGGGAT